MNRPPRPHVATAGAGRDRRRARGRRWRGRRSGRGRSRSRSRGSTMCELVSTLAVRRSPIPTSPVSVRTTSATCRASSTGATSSCSRATSWRCMPRSARPTRSWWSTSTTRSTSRCWSRRSDLDTDDRAAHRAGDDETCSTSSYDAGDFFLCASDKQRDFWLGQLAARRTHQPRDLRRRREPRGSDRRGALRHARRAARAHAAGPARASCPGIDRDDKVILWGGGVYNWFDPLTLLRAVDKLRAPDPQRAPVLPRAAAPQPACRRDAMAVDTRALADELGLTGHARVLQRGLGRVRRSPELPARVGRRREHAPRPRRDRFSFRTRILDYFWAGLPVVATDGDALGRVDRRTRTRHHRPGRRRRRAGRRAPSAARRRRVRRRVRCCIHRAGGSGCGGPTCSSRSSRSATHPGAHPISSIRSHASSPSDLRGEFAASPRHRDRVHDGAEWRRPRALRADPDPAPQPSQALAPRPSRRCDESNGLASRAGRQEVGSCQPTSL